MKEIHDVIRYLKEYDGRNVRIMEICGTHTASIFKNGIRSMISPKIKLISGPGCPVCVTPAEYIDRCIEYALRPGHVLATFGDMMKVPGTKGSLTQAKAQGARVQMMYSPEALIDKALEDKDTTFVVAAVGFETTVPAYCLLIKAAMEQGIHNILILTALRTVMPALEWLCSVEQDIDGFIAPGHASVIIGSEVYKPLAEQYKKPFAVAGFEAEHVLTALYDLVKQISEGEHEVRNYYKNVVRTEGNVQAKAIIDEYFESGDAYWRGLGSIPNSGLYLRAQYRQYDAGSFELGAVGKVVTGCRCGEVITGRIDPNECPMFGTVCNPLNAQGPCMVSSEGTCGIWYRNAQR